MGLTDTKNLKQAVLSLPFYSRFFANKMYKKWYVKQKSEFKVNSKSLSSERKTFGGHLLVS